MLEVYDKNHREPLSNG